MFTAEPHSDEGRPRRGKRPPGRPKLEQVELIDSELLEGALREFLRNGYGGTSIAQIVKRLGISKTTLYSRFPSKADLFRAIIIRQIEGLSALTPLQENSVWLELGSGLRAYGNRMLEISLQGDLLALNRLIYSESHRFPELGAAAAERSSIGIRQISDFISECCKRDGVRCRDPEGVAAAFIFMLRGWYVDVMLKNEPITAAVRETWVERAVHALVAGRSDW